MKLLACIGTLFALLALGQAALAVDPGPVHQCGTFVSYRAADSVQSGQLVIGSTTYATSSGNPTPFRQVIAPGATTGSQVCLDGTVVASQTTANLLTDFTVSPAPAASALPTAAPTSVAPATPSVAPSVLPSASAQPQTGTVGVGFIWLLVAIAAVALIGFLFARSRRTPSS